MTEYKHGCHDTLPNRSKAVAITLVHESDTGCVDLHIVMTIINRKQCA